MTDWPQLLHTYVPFPGFSPVVDILKLLWFFYLARVGVVALSVSLDVDTTKKNRFHRLNIIFMINNVSVFLRGNKHNGFELRSPAFFAEIGPAIILQQKSTFPEERAHYANVVLRGVAIV